MARFFLIVFMLLIAIALKAEWQDDILGNGYKKMYIYHPRDYSGSIRSTIIRKMSHCQNRRGILYIHGYNDYFFQNEMGNRFVDSCFHFYAVDLRKYGRSLINGQSKFQVRDIREYFADIDSAISVMKQDGITQIVLMGHSTGGLTASLYMAEHAHPLIVALILNSPFLDWNLGPLESFIPIISGIVGIFPNISIAQGGSDAYAKSLLDKFSGEWTYNTNWKMIQSPNVDTGWIRAIDQAQMKLHNGVNIAVPILLMRSAKSHNTNEWDSICNQADIVLDVNDIKKYGHRLGHNITEMTVYGGVHDLFLSDKMIRDDIYDEIFEWLDQKVF